MTSRSARIWSVWEMLTREADSFINALAACERIHVLVEHGVGVPADPTTKITDSLKKLAGRHLRDLSNAFDGMSVKAAAASVRKAQQKLRDGLNYKEMGELNKDIFSRFKDEMSGRYFFFLDEEEAALFDVKKPPFGEAVAGAFPLAVFDLEEADKCLAVGRYTASVFHQMRAAEAAAVVVADKVGATTHDASGEQLSLGILTANIDGKITAMTKGPKKDDWLKVPYLLHSCNRAYRTKTAHPADVYTQEQAERARQATCALLQEFAELLGASAAV